MYGNDAIVFAQALRDARRGRMSLRELARRTHYSHSYLSKVEHGVKPPSEELARRCDQALGMGGALVVAAQAQLAANGQVGLWPRPMQLPASPVTFVGRDREMARLDALFGERELPAGSVPIVVIEGSSGVGKTALALRWAHQHVADFGDGVLFARLQSTVSARQPAEPGDVLAGFLRAMGILPNELPGDLEQRESLYRSLLNGRRMLVLLDDAANSVQVQSLLPGSAGCRVLVTSRSRLSGLAIASDAVSIALDRLGEGQAFELMAAIIGRQRAEYDPASLAMIADLCGYVPLDLRIAAERIRSLPDVPLDQFLDEMAARPRGR